MSRSAAITAVVYLILATAIVIRESLFNQNAFGNGLRYMLSFLITAPVSVPLAILGHEPDLSNRWTLAAVIMASTAIVYFVILLLVRLAGAYTSR